MGTIVGVLSGAAAMAVSLVCLYLVMRTVGLEHGGSCVSGGPYLIAPGHECESGVFALAYGSLGGLVVGCLTVLWSSHRYGGPLVLTSASALSWSAFFGGLGGNFLSIGAELPDSSDAGAEFKTVGIIFLVMASIGLVVAAAAVVHGMISERLDVPSPTAGAWFAWFGSHDWCRDRSCPRLGAAIWNG